MVGVNTQNFNPTNDGLDFVTVHSSKTLTPGLFNLGVFLNFAVNTLPNYEDITTQKRTNFNDSLVSSDVNFAVGLLTNWEVGLSIPALLSQSVESDVAAASGQFENTGLTEFRLMTKLRVWSNQNSGVALVGSSNFNQIEDDPFAGEGAGPTFNFEIAADRQVGPIQIGINAGYRLRSPGTQLLDIPVVPMGDQYIGSLAVSYLLANLDVKIIGELFGSVPVDSQAEFSDRELSTLEALVGLKTDLTPSLAWHLGGGTEVIHGTSSPDWRVYTGLNWVVGPVFSEPQEVIVKVKDQPLRALEDLDATDAYIDPPAEVESFIARDILFEFNSDRLRPTAAAKLQKLVDYLMRTPVYSMVTVEGHTDSIGKRSYNLELSQRRASRVRQALVSMGLESQKVRAIGYGASRPIANNGNFQGRAMNRRVEFQVQR